MAAAVRARVPHLTEDHYFADDLAWAQQAVLEGTGVDAAGEALVSLLA